MQESAMNHAAAVGSSNVVSEHICVVYNSKTGEVVHVHHVVNLRGANVTERPEAEARAIELALAIGKGRNRLQMKTLFASRADLIPAGRFKVDLRSNKLVVSTERSKKSSKRT